MGESRRDKVGVFGAVNIVREPRFGNGADAKNLIPQVGGHAVFKKFERGFFALERPERKTPSGGAPCVWVNQGMPAHCNIGIVGACRVVKLFKEFRVVSII